MHQAILVHADVDERTEGGDVADHAFQHHARLEVLDVLHAVGEARRLELRARVAARLFQFLEDVAHRRQAELLVGELVRLESAQETAIADQRLDRLAGGTDDALDHRIGFRVHRRSVQRLLAIGDAQEAGALFERLVAQPRHLEQVLAALERAVVVAVAHDVLGHARRQPGHARQQRRRGGVDVHADRVHAVLHPGVQRPRQAVLVDVVLVLAHADRLGLDLDQFRQRILQAPRDRHRAAQRHVELRELLGGELGRRIHRGTGLADHDLFQLQLRVLLDQVRGQLVGLAAGGAVADRDQFDAVLRAQLPQRVQRLVPLPARLVRIDGVGGQQLAGGVDHRDLATGTDARVQAQGHARPGRRRQHQILQVVAEHRDRLGLGLFARLVEQVQQQVHVQLGAPGQATGIQQPAVARAALVGDAGAQRDAAFGVLVAGFGLAAGIQLQIHDLLATRAEQRQQPVRRNLGQCFGVIEVVAVLGAFLLLALGHAGADDAHLAQPRAQFADQCGILAPALHQDRARAFQRGLDVGHTLVGIDEAGGEGFRHLARIGQQAVGERFQPGLAGDLRARAPLRLVWQVQIFQPRLGVGGDDLRTQFVAELALLGDAGEHRSAALFQFAQIGQAHFQVAQLGVVEPAGDFLAVACDERDAGALVEQGDGGARLRRLRADLGGDGVGDLLGELSVVHCVRPKPPCGKPAFSQCARRRGTR
ncbi:hypothetical protein NB706_001349 [Xanthomonas sacchari]|nr:hypothetical protein [Xanthomonas sacchari]